MRKRYIFLFIMFFFTLSLVMPVFAEEAAEELIVSENDMVLPAELGEGVITGEVISLDAGTSAITVKPEGKREITFSVVDGETILWRGIEDIALSDIEEGEEAEVGYYTDEEDNYIASWVDIIVEEDMTPLTSSVGAEPIS